MAEKLVVISDIWGAKKGLWMTSYLSYLQQYFAITYYDIQQLAKIDQDIESEEELNDAFLNGGIEKAVSQLIKSELEPCHFLTFSIGGTIAWKANLKGLPMKSLYSVSATGIRLEHKKPDIPLSLVYGEDDSERPSEDWFKEMSLDKEILPQFGHQLYADEKVIKKVCLDLLNSVTNKLGVVEKGRVINLRDSF